MFYFVIVFFVVVLSMKHLADILPHLCDILSFSLSLSVCLSVCDQYIVDYYNKNHNSISFECLFLSKFILMITVYVDLL